MLLFKVGLLTLINIDSFIFVIMDGQDYINKANTLLNENTYREIPQVPTNTIKNKLISILKRVKNQTGLDSLTYKSMYPTGCVPPKLYGLPEIHKLDIPLRPIVSTGFPFSMMTKFHDISRFFHTFPGIIFIFI